MNMDEIHKDYGRFKKRATELQKWVLNNFKQEDVYNKIIQNMSVQKTGEDDV